MNVALRNMSKCRFALLLLALGANHAAAQNSVTLYGIYDAGLTYVNNVHGSSLTEMKGNGAVPSLFGVVGNEDLGGGTSTIFKLASFYTPTTGAAPTPFWTLSYVGLHNATFGTLTLGRQFDFLQAAAALPADSTMLVQGAMIEGYAGFASTTPGAPPPAVDNHTNVPTYNSSIKWEQTIDNWSGGLMFGFGPNSPHDTMTSAYLKFISGGFQIGIGWTRDNFSQVVLANEVYSIRALYKTGALTLFSNYAQGRETVYPGSRAAARPFEIGFDYYISPAWAFGAGVGWARDTDRAGNNATLIQPFVGTRYSFSKRTTVYALSGFNHSSNPAVIPATVSTFGGATGVSDNSGQLAIRIGIVTFF